MDIYCCSYTISTVKPNPWQRGSKNPKFGQASFMDAPFRMLLWYFIFQLIYLSVLFALMKMPWKSLTYKTIESIISFLIISINQNFLVSHLRQDEFLAGNYGKEKGISNRLGKLLLVLSSKNAYQWALWSFSMPEGDE